MVPYWPLKLKLAVLPLQLVLLLLNVPPVLLTVMDVRFVAFSVVLYVPQEPLALYGNTA